MERLIQATLSAKQSVAQVIWRSDVFTNWFKNHVQAMENCPFGNSVRNLRAAKHRFESHSKPLARIVLWFPAIVLTMADIASHRDTQQEGRWAKEWLAHVQPRDLLLLGLMADAADEGIGLIRLADDECGAWSSDTGATCATAQGASKAKLAPTTQQRPAQQRRGLSMHVPRPSSAVPACHGRIMFAPTCSSSLTHGGALTSRRCRAGCASSCRRFSSSSMAARP